jgi:hypothetical protein
MVAMQWMKNGVALAGHYYAIYREHLMPLGTTTVYVSRFVKFGLLFVVGLRVLYCDWLG